MTRTTRRLNLTAPFLALALVFQSSVAKGQTTAQSNAEAVPPANTETALPERGSQETDSSNRLVERVRAIEDRVDRLLERLNERGFYPEGGSIVSGSGIALGLGVRRLRILDAGPISGEIEASWSTRGYRQYEAFLGRIDNRRTTLQLAPADTNLAALFNDRSQKMPGSAAYLAVRNSHYPRVDFFGVGPVRTEMETDYSVGGSAVEGAVQWQPTYSFGVAVRAGILDLEAGRGTDPATPDVIDRFSADEAPGLLQQPRYMTAGVGLALDTRDSVKLPTSGAFVGAVVWRFVPLDVQHESFTRSALDLRAYKALPGERTRHVTAARLLASTDHAPGHSPVPFYLQRWLGGTHSLRGYESYRFRGQAIVHLSVEHRWRITKHLDVVPFVDAGAVATSVRGLSASPLEVTPGLGLRVRTDDRVLFGVEWARRHDGNRFIFSLKPGF